MTGRLLAWLRRDHSVFAMAACASEGCFYAQACYLCSQAAEKALKVVLLALGQEPERTQSPPLAAAPAGALGAPPRWRC